jgi:hypothetical protein
MIRMLSAQNTRKVIADGSESPSSVAPPPSSPKPGQSATRNVFTASPPM